MDAVFGLLARVLTILAFPSQEDQHLSFAVSRLSESEFQIIRVGARTAWLVGITRGNLQLRSESRFFFKLRYSESIQIEHVAPIATVALIEIEAHYFEAWRLRKCRMKIPPLQQVF